MPSVRVWIVKPYQHSNSFCGESHPADTISVNLDHTQCVSESLSVIIFLTAT